MSKSAADIPEGLVLLTCSVDDAGSKLHPCQRAHAALREAGHEYETVIFDRNRPFGLFTGGKRPELKKISGQEKLPVLRLADGSTVNGGGEIAAWAKENAPT